jgi:hypothetical protein
MTSTAEEGTPVLLEIDLAMVVFTQCSKQRPSGVESLPLTGGKWLNGFL